MVALAGDPRTAMYTPLGTIGKNAGEFPLHADLYIPTLLFNVFDNVSSEGSSASTFLSVASLRRLIPAVPSLPAARGRAIAALFERETRKDQFEVLYDLLHGEHRWVPALERAMTRRQLAIRLQAGQGYLLHDRKWLHGRAAPDGSVPVDRLRRLVFDGSQMPPPQHRVCQGARGRPQEKTAPRSDLRRALHTRNTGRNTPT